MGFKNVFTSLLIYRRQMYDCQTLRQPPLVYDISSPLYMYTGIQAFGYRTGNSFG